MGYGIMRVEKRGRGSVYGLQIEAQREQGDGRDFDASDIDWSRTGDNYYIGPHADNWNREITRQIHEAGVKERKDSIVMLDGLYTASPEWFEKASQREQEKYFEDCYDFHVREYCGGDPRRVISARVHLDEATPHLTIHSVPIAEDEKGFHLSAKTIMGGRDDYRLRQDRFYEQVTRSRGLERGEVRDFAETKKHLLVQEYKEVKGKENIEHNKKVIQQQQEKYDKLKRSNTELKAERDALKKQLASEKELRQSMDTISKTIKHVQDLYQSAITAEVKHPLIGGKNEITEQSVTDACDALERSLNDCQKAVKGFKTAHTALTKMKNNEEQLITDRVNEQIQQMHQETLRLNREARKDRDEAQRLKEQYQEYKDNEESYILGTADQKVKETFEKSDIPDQKAKRLEQFLDSYTVGNKTLLDVWHESERALQKSLSHDERSR